MPSKSLHMETTNVSVSKTCGEIEEYLAKHGVSEVYKRYENGNVEAINFVMHINGENLPFSLPFRWQSIQKMAQNGRTGYKKTADEEQARKVAARITLRWVEAQFALIEVGMADVAEVFLPYVVNKSGETLYQKMIQNGGLKMLNSGK